MTELLPCPFCGGEAHVYMTLAQRYCAICNKPFCANVGPFETEAEAVAAWNIRADTEYGAVPATEGNMTAHGWVRERTCRIVKTWSDSDYVDDWNYRCSECRGFIPVNERDPETGDVISAANYCPNCGCKVVKQ